VPTATAQTIINQALTELNVLAEGEAPTNDASIDALQLLNQLIDGWKAQRLQIHTITRSTWTITSGTGQYTFGASGDVTTRPVIMDHVGYIDTSPSPDHETIVRLITEAEWAGISEKAQTSDTPSVAYYNPVFPQATLDYWPVPSSTTLSGVAYYPDPVGELSALSTSLSVPPGYQRMMVKNLAMELCPSYSKQPSVLLVRQAMDSLDTVKRANWQPRDLSFDPAITPSGRRSYDIKQG
jgi:hypothetical protein